MTNSLEPSSSFGSSDPSPKSDPRRRDQDASRRGDGDGRGRLGLRLPVAERSAQSWIGEVGRDLVEDGVHAQVTLFEGDREVYGPMSLHAAG